MSTPENTEAEAPLPHKPPFFATSMGLVFLAVVFYIAAMVAGALATGAISTREPQPEQSATEHMLTTYMLYVPGLLLMFFGTCCMIIGSVRWAMYGRTAASAPTESSDAEVLDLLASINHRLLVSDTAKRIAYRHEDVEVLRRTIATDIEKHQFDAAMILIEELANTYGFREESEVLREKVTLASKADQEAKIDAALKHLEEIMERHDYVAARNEADKLKRLYPNAHRVRSLDHHIEQTLEQYKHELEREFLIASQRDDIEKADALLHELDKYLTPEEAAPFRETARGVIGKKRDNLGVQFKLAVQDKEWIQAVQTGEQIIREFPNSQMANEIRDRLDLLRDRAAGQRAAAPRNT